MTMIDTGIRVALREITETAYRALRVIGASHGEAQATAEAVQFAELRDGTGIRALVSDLEAEAWHPSGLSATLGAQEGAPYVEVEPGARRGVSAVGQALIELAAGRREPVVYPRILGVSSVLDLPLLQNARLCGDALMIAEQKGSWGQIRIATAEGLLGHGAVTAAVTTRLPLLASDRTCVVPVPSLPETLSQILVWETAVDRERKRRSVARDGLVVAPEAWRDLREAARGYLQPETA